VLDFHAQALATEQLIPDDRVLQATQAVDFAHDLVTDLHIGDPRASRSELRPRALSVMKELRYSISPATSVIMSLVWPCCVSFLTVDA
jgi:hypothetical protein